MNNILEVKNLETTFINKDNKTKVLNGISFDLQKEHILGIVGESGSGKSVTMLSIMKLLDKRNTTINGEILFCGTDISKYNEKEMQKIRGKKISMIFQDPMTALNPVWSIGYQLLESIHLHTNLRGTSASDKIIELLTQVGISDAKERLSVFPHELSGGMRQRVMIAMALCSSPDILIADEPTTALDVTVQAEILELIKSLTKVHHMSTIIITHDLGVVVDLCDEICVLYAGRICEKGTTYDIFKNPKHEYTKGLLNSVPTLKGNKRMNPIGGNPINIQALPSGCPFYPRCKSSMKICKIVVPPLKSFGNNHYASCFMNEINSEDK
ncbi:MAG: ABC transporter ATP-binding protein [Eubacteriales bacterium]|nr:ABC transporter ATP-binding protein [Eubacteriales bacterium]